jgi:hypothetical protein
MSDAFSRLVGVLAAARRVVQPRPDGAIEKSPPSREFVFRRHLAAVTAFIASPASTELAMLLIWGLGALLFVFTYCDPLLGSEFLPGVAMN